MRKKLKVCNSLFLLTYSILSSAGEFSPTFDVFTPSHANANFTSYKALPSQADYSKHFSDSHTLWGVKFLSNYLGLSELDRPLPSFKSSQTHIDHELGVLAYIGRSFSNGHVYLGGGPSLFGTKSSVHDGLGLNEPRSTDVLNVSLNGVNSRVLWGGAAQLGMSYYFDPTWYLDLNYTYAIAGRNNVTPQSNYQDVGPFYVNATQRLTAQALAVSVKKFFTF